MSLNIIIPCPCGFLSRLNLLVLNRKEDGKKTNQAEADLLLQSLTILNTAGVYREELKIWTN